MIESIGLAAGKFAVQYAGRQLLDRRKLQELAKAYRQSAEETIDHCEQEGHPAKSPVWDSVVSLLRSEERAGQVALWYTQGRASYEDLQDVIGDDPTVGHFIKEFIVRLNDRCAVLLPPDLANLAGILNRRLVLLGQQAQREAPQPLGRTTIHLVGIGSEAQGRLQSSRLALTYYGGTPRIHWDWEGWMESLHRSVLILAVTIIKNTSVRQLAPPSRAQISLYDKTDLKVAEVNIHFTNDDLLFEYEGTYRGYEGFHLENPTEERMRLLWHSEFTDELTYERLMAQDTSDKSYRRYVEMFVPRIGT